MLPANAVRMVQAGNMPALRLRTRGRPGLTVNKQGLGDRADAAVIAQ
jgi:hypothetical protein